MSFAIGSLLGDVFYHTLPHLYKQTPDHILINCLVICGIITFFIIEKGIAYCMTEKDEDIDKRYKQYAILTFIGDLLHNLTDGLSIGVAYIASNDCYMCNLV